MSLRIQVMSDLHFEFHRDRGAEFVRMLDPKDVDVLVIAGDLCVEKTLEEALAKFCERYPEVVYVAGNHEHYRSSPNRVADVRARVSARHGNLHWLENLIVVLGGVRFVGATLWFPDTVLARTNTALIADFEYISGLVPWVYERNNTSSRFLWNEVREGDVVVTHHLPSVRSVAKQFVGSSLNCYFLSDEERTIAARAPAFWFHGHTHTTCDYFLGTTRVVCNPFGYPSSLNRVFNDRLVLSVEASVPAAAVGDAL